MREVLRTKSVCKYFPGVKALKNITLTFEEGQIYGLVGENGAGKSTLIKCIMGYYQPTEGKLIVRGKEVKIDNTYQARIRFGMDSIFQEAQLVSNLSIAENIFLLDLERFYNNGILDVAEIRKKARKALQKIDLDLDVTNTTDKLDESEKKWVEFAKILFYDSNFIIMDEFTAPMSRNEVEKLFGIMRDLKKEGKTIIFITHRLGETMEICDEILVLRDGNFEGRVKNEGEKAYIRKKIVKLLTGKERGLQFPEKEGSTSKKVIFATKNLENKWIKDVNLNIREREIVCLAGLRGQGQAKLLRTIIGDLPKERGEVYLNDTKITPKDPQDAVKKGVIYISDNKDQDHLWLTQDVKFNISMPSIDKYSRFGFIVGKKQESNVREMVSKLKIGTPSIAQMVRNLSGGNRQKVVLAATMLQEPKLLLANQPTKGLDVGTKEQIYSLLRDIANQGIPILLVLTELEEILNLPDRVLVMQEGRLSKEFTGKISAKELLSAYYM